MFCCFHIDASEDESEKVSSSRRKDKKVPEGHTVLFDGATRHGSLSGKGDSVKTVIKSRKEKTPAELSIDEEGSGVFVPVSLTKRQVEKKAERTPAEQADGKSERTPGRVATRLSSKVLFPFSQFSFCIYFTCRSSINMFYSYLVHLCGRLLWAIIYLLLPLSQQM